MRRYVVICCGRNTASKLDACLRSLSSQQYANFTVVVVDDASTDSSREVAALWCNKEGWTLIARDERFGAVRNQWDAIHLSSPIRGPGPRESESS
jgi:glycosyltransferase involved in cell wall biosynthesis